MFLNASAVNARVCAADCTSTIGVSPVTVIVSDTAPTFKSAFTDAVKFAVTSIPSRFTPLNPGSVNVTLYTPGAG